MAKWCRGCEASSGGISRKDGTKEFRPLKISCHSNHIVEVKRLHR